MAMISGTQANLVNNPSIKRMAQKNSANITRMREILLPICKKFMNLYWRELKSAILLYPYFNIKVPKPTRNKKSAVLTAPAECFVEYNAFMILFYNCVNIVLCNLKSFK